MLNHWDYLAVAAYFALIALLCLYVVVFKARVASTSASEDYFLAGRSASWWLVGGSLFASNIGSEHLIGLAGTAAASGVAVAQFELIAVFMLIALGWVFAPIYIRMGVYTMPEFLEQRFGPACRWYLALVSILAYVLTKISITVAAGSLVLQQVVGIDFWWGALLLVLVTGLYTIAGGLRVVLYTDAMQTLILLTGSIVITVLGLMHLGGPLAFIETVQAERLSLWRPMSDPDFPWTGIVLGAPILGLWYWCTDQFIVQRVLSAKSQVEAQKGVLLAAALKVLPLFIFVLPGMMAAEMAAQGRFVLESNDYALVRLVGEVIPAGWRGLFVSGLLAALMSSLSSVFNSCSTLITMDVFKRLRPQSSESQLVWTGRIATVFLVVVGILWIPLMQRISTQMYQYLQSVQAYIAPPITAVFLLGIFSKSVNSAGAMSALLVGLVIGLSRMVFEVGGYDLGVLSFFVELNFLHFAFVLFVFSAALATLVSWCSGVSTDRFKMDAQVQWHQLKSNRSTGIGLVTVMLSVVLIWWAFSPWGWAR